MDVIRDRLLFYGRNTNLHGLRYVADRNNNIITRIVWLIIFILSSIGMMRIFKGSYDSFQHNAISFVTETTYLDWNTTFPAISVCEIASTDVMWTSEPSDAYSPIQQFLTDIIYFTGSCYSCSMSTVCNECERLNFKEVVVRYRKKCDKLIRNCRWNNFNFNCCDHFLPINTEYGVCYSINSLHTLSDKEKLRLISNQNTGPGELGIEASDDIRIYIHSPEDVPFINSDLEQRKDVMLGETYTILINIIEIANDENVIAVPIEKRRCRFPQEKPPDLKVHSHYSYSTCIVQCHADAHIRLCNCTHHLMPVLGDDDYCTREGLQCLTEYFETVNRLHAKGFDKPGLVCECLPSCVEPEYTIISSTKGERAEKSELSIKLQSLPTFRFKRNVVRTTMDLVVSIGGTAGLFIGASLLSIIETVYLLCLRRH